MHKIIDFTMNQLGIKLHPGQAVALSDYYTSGRSNWLMLAGRRSGKSLISDIVAVYESLVPSFADVLRPGEERFIILISVRQDSANLHIENISRILRRSKSFKGMIEERTKERIRLSNGVTILSLPASGRSVRGYTASCVILDELAHFVDTQGNNSADGVFDAVTPTLATFGDLGRLIITTTPAARTGIVYDLYDRSSRGELEDFYLTKAATREMNPSVSERTINRAMTRDSQSASVEYFAEFADPTAAYLDSDTIDRAIDRRHKTEKGEKNQRYVMAIDPATMGDRYAFMICHRENGKIVHDFSHIMLPPVDPNAAEDLLFDLVNRFNPDRIRCDTAATVERLKGKIPRLEYTPFSRPMKLRIYGALKESFNLSQISIYKDENLIDELRALQIRNGVDISAPKSGRVKHDDLADCLALCVDALTGEEKISVIADPFAIWPIPEGATYHPRVGYGNWDQRPHAPGVTWENCKRRNTGCLACITEMENEGVYENDKKEAELIASQGVEDRSRPNLFDQAQAEAESRRGRTLSIFWEKFRQDQKEKK